MPKIAQGLALGAKAGLTSHEKIKAAYMHYILGWSQSDIQIALDGVNAARVHEACSVLWGAAGGTVTRYKKADSTLLADPTLTKRGTPKMTTEERRAKASVTMKKSWAARKKGAKKATVLPSKKRAARKAKIMAKQPPAAEEQREAS